MSAVKEGQRDAMTKQREGVHPASGVRNGGVLQLLNGANFKTPQHTLIFLSLNFVTLDCSSCCCTEVLCFVSTKGKESFTCSEGNKNNS